METKNEPSEEKKPRLLAPDVAAFAQFLLSVVGICFIMMLVTPRVRELYCSAALDLPMSVRLVLVCQYLLWHYWQCWLIGLVLLGLLPCFLAKGRAWRIYLIGSLAVLVLALGSFFVLTRPAPKAREALAERRAALTAKPAPGDPIATLVWRLNTTNGLWTNGMCPTISLPQSAGREQVIAEAVKAVRFDKGPLARHETREVRNVALKQSGGSACYSAVLIETDQGTKILLFTYDYEGHRWWARFYDAPGDDLN